MTSTSEYLGELRVKSVHLQSGEVILSDAPIDNNGKGEAFSPTDMTATSLACCMLTIMGIVANKRSLNIQGTTAQITKTMASEPRRISKIEIIITMPKIGVDDNIKELLEKIAKDCPVAHSLHPDIEQVIEFVW